MPLDPRIAFMARGPQIEPAQAAIMRALQMQGAIQGNRLQALQAQDMTEQRALQRKMLENQLLQQQSAQAEADRMRAARQALPSPQMLSASNALAGGGGPTVANAANQRPADHAAMALFYAIQNGILPATELEKVYNPNYGRQEVARTIEVDDEQGGKRIVSVDKYNNPVGSERSGYVPLERVDLGGSVDFLKARPGLSMKKTMSPSERDASARGWAGIGIQRAAENRLSAPPQSKPLPGAALRIVDDARDKIGVTYSVNADLNAVHTQLEDGTLDLGPVSNLMSRGKNYAGMSDENSRNYASFKANMERLRNESLRLNKGVQTEGDSERAWNELFANLNDNNVVKQRLKEIIAQNARAAELQKLRADQTLTTYGHEPLDDSTIKRVSPALNQQKSSNKSTTAPPGVDQRVWDFMTDEQKKLWQKN